MLNPAIPAAPRFYKNMTSCAIVFSMENNRSFLNFGLFKFGFKRYYLSKTYASKNLNKLTYKLTAKCIILNSSQLMAESMEVLSFGFFTLTFLLVFINI